MDREDGAWRRRRIVVDGPLAPFVVGLRGELSGQGYATDTICRQVRLLADLSGWLAERGLGVAGLSSAVVQEFVRARRVAGRRTGRSERALASSLAYLRRLGVAPPPAVPAVATPLDVLLVEYRRYLEGERGLAAQTVVHYLHCARVFLAWLPGPLEQSLPALSAAQVVGYVRDWTARRQGASIDTVRLPAVRSLLRYLHVAGHVPRSLAGAVPAGRGRPRNAMPRAASTEGVRAVLASCDRDSAVGRRDYAILLLMARLALRGGEVGRLELADVNWRCGE